MDLSTLSEQPNKAIDFICKQVTNMSNITSSSDTCTLKKYENIPSYAHLLSKVKIKRKNAAVL